MNEAVISGRNALDFQDFMATTVSQAGPSTASAFVFNQPECADLLVAKQTAKRFTLSSMHLFRGNFETVVKFALSCIASAYSGPRSFVLSRNLRRRAQLSS